MSSWEAVIWNNATQDTSKNDIHLYVTGKVYEYIQAFYALPKNYR